MCSKMLRLLIDTYHIQTGAYTHCTKQRAIMFSSGVGAVGGKKVGEVGGNLYGHLGT